MGIIAAIGGGRYDNGEIVSIIKDIRDLCSKENPKMVFLPTASHDNTEKNNVYMKQAFIDNGCTVEDLFLTDKSLTEEQIKEKILGADIIYIGGGDTGFMMRTWKKTHADRYLLEAYEKGIIMSGYSAGALCWFDTGYDDCGKDHSYTFVKCLGVFPFCCCPHAESDSWRSFWEAIKTRDENGLALDDGACLIFDGDKIRYVCGNEDGDVHLFRKDNGHTPENITDNPEILKSLM